MHNMNWNDLHYALSVARNGSLLRAAKELGVTHTTVGRRIDALEQSLGAKLFHRARSGMMLTAEGHVLLPELTRVDDTIQSIQRTTSFAMAPLAGTVRVTSGESFASCYLAPRLASFAAKHRGLTVELIAGGQVLDLARREADIAIRMFRSEHKTLVVRRLGTLGYGLYAHPKYLRRAPIRKPADFKKAAMLSSEGGARVPEAEWVRALSGGAAPRLVSNLSMGLAEAARSGLGIAVLPRYMGDADRTLTRVPAPDAPSESIWLTVHEDARHSPRVRAVMDYLIACVKSDSALLAGT